MTDFPQKKFPRAGFRRRFGSWVYDVLIALAVYMVAGAIAFLLFNILIKFGVINMQGFEHAIDLQNSSFVYSGLIYGWNIAWVSFFFVFLKPSLALPNCKKNRSRKKKYDHHNQSQDITEATIEWRCD